MRDTAIKTILITGGAGFIGSHLVKKYLDEGHRVLCVDNLQTTGDDKNIRPFRSHPRFSFIRHDIIKPIAFREPIDWIFNLACSGSYTSYQWNPVHTMQTNTVGMINMLELARVHGARILQASTSEIYGDPEEVPQKETYRGNVNSLGPRACYDEGKRSAETLCMDYHREHGVDVKIIRIFNTYGPNMDPNDGRAVTNFILRAIDRQDLVIYGDGSNTRSFQYIDDLVEGIDRMMRSEQFVGPVNLGNPGEITMKALAEKVLTLAGGSSKIVYEREATDDPKRRCPDITLAKKKLGWEPRVGVDEGLSRTIEYFRTVERPHRKVLVFATTFLPHMGPAEEALHGLMRVMPDTEFHVVTGRFAPEGTARLASKETVENVSIHRVGTGLFLDKYLLPVTGVMKGAVLTKEHNYVFVWSIMASYAGLTGLLYKLAHPRSLLFVTLDDREVERHRWSHQALVARLVLRAAHNAYVSKLSKISNSSLLRNIDTVSARGGDARSFAARVHHAYAEALNKLGNKLSRPK